MASGVWWKGWGEVLICLLGSLRVCLGGVGWGSGSSVWEWLQVYRRRVGVRYFFSFATWAAMAGYPTFRLYD